MNQHQEFCPKSQADWRKWLKKHHQSEDAVWLIFYKKKSPQFNLSWSDAVDEALCYGWIDSTKRSIDDEKYKQYFTKRKAKSNWSKINKDKIKALIDKNLMAEAGLKSIEIAKENGSWTVLDDIENLVLPEDLKKALDNIEGAMAFYEGLSNSFKKQFLYWVNSAKRPATRDKRIQEIAKNAEKGLKPEQFR